MNADLEPSTKPNINTGFNSLLTLCLLGLVLLNGVLFVGYQWLGWDPASIAPADQARPALAPQTIQPLPPNASAPPAFVPTPAQTAPVVTAVCYQWGAFVAKEATSWGAKTRQAGLPTPTELNTPMLTSHAIVMGPYTDRVSLDKKLVELKRLQLKEAVVVEGLSIFLGWFGTESAANKQFQALGKQGVRSAKVLRQSRSIPKTTLRFDALNSSQVVRLKAIASHVGVLSACPAP